MREELDRILDVSWDVKDVDIRLKVEALIANVYADATPEEIEEVASKFRYAFKIPDVHPFVENTTDESTSAEEDSANFEALINKWGGFPSRYLEWVEEQESPAQFHFGSMITLAAGGLKRRPLLTGWEARDVYPNLYTLLIGPSGCRKGAAMSLAKKLMVDPFDVNVFPQEGTPQGFASKIRLRYNKTGIADGVVISDEFKVLVSEDRNKRELFVWLTDWYDSPDTWPRALQSDPDYDVRKFYINVLGGSTVDWMKRLPADSAMGGFMPRFIMFEAKGKRHWKALPKFSKTLERELRETLRFIAKRVSDTIEFDPAAERWITHWYEVELREQSRNTPEESIQKWYERKQAAVLKIAVIWQILDGESPTTLYKEYMERARAVVDWADRGIMRTYRSLGETIEGEPSQEVLNFIRNAGGNASSRTIYRAFRSRYRKAKIDEALTTLKSTGELESRIVPHTGMSWSTRRV